VPCKQGHKYQLRSLGNEKVFGFADLHRSDFRFHFCREQAQIPYVLRCIMRVAGELGDRWLGHRKMAGREESPDTVVVGSQEPVTK
jgi:hypothetical protein